MTSHRSCAGSSISIRPLKLRKPVFAILKEIIPAQKGEGKSGHADPNNGRPGMAQWTILVLGVLRLGFNADYDRIQELANQHKTIRLMLGHSDWLDETQYALQTLKDNLRLFTPEILDKINIEVVRAGHQALKKSLQDGLVARCDSFVVETDVHLWLRRMSIFLPTSTYCWMPSAKSLISAPSWLRRTIFRGGGKAPIISASLKSTTERSHRLYAAL